MTRDLDLRKISCQEPLPICKWWDELAQAIKENQVIIVTGETGCGKTTQIPKICLKSGRGKKGIIGCCQPRRIAAISVAQRVSQELSPIGKNLVGYKIRFNFRLPEALKIKFMTDGILLSEMQKDPSLSAYDTIILDEAHERSINIDLISGILKRILERRRNLKIIITSATMEVEKFQKFFGNPPVYHIEGRQFPVKVIYEESIFGPEKKELSLNEKVLLAVKKIRSLDTFGDILVFLPTEKSIYETKRLLEKELRGEIVILPLFSRLSKREQTNIFKRFNRQKVILSTNIAETSITVPGIRYVIDSGLARISQYNINTHIKGLPVSKISKANANQRAGRAGRMEKGLCIRLFEEEDFLSRDDFQLPEIQRCSLSEVILKLLYLGHKDIENFPFIDPPKRAAIKEGVHLLLELGAIDKELNLTPMGKKMARLPLDPRLSRIIFQAREEGVLEEIICIVSALSLQELWEAGKNKDYSGQGDFIDKRSDFFTYLRLWNEIVRLKKKGVTRRELKEFLSENSISFQRVREWEDISSQIGQLCYELKITKKKEINLNFKNKILRCDSSNVPLFEAIHRSLLTGFLGNIAIKKEKGRAFLGTKGKEIFIHPSSSLFKEAPKWILSAEQVRTTKLFARTVGPIKPQWVEEFANSLCKYQYFEPKWSKERGEAVVKEAVRFYGLTIISGRSRSLKAIDANEARRLLINEGLTRCQLKGHYKFNEHNKKVLDELYGYLKKRRLSEELLDEAIIEAFFKKVLDVLMEETGVQIVDEMSLIKAIKLSKKGESALFLNKELVFSRAVLESSELLYPGHIEIDGQSLPLVYRFCPGLSEDGVTVKVPVILVPFLEFKALEWLVPGLLEEKIEFLLKRVLRKKEIFRDTEIKSLSRDVTKALNFQEGNLKNELIKKVHELKGIRFSLSELPSEKELPPHLRFRIEVIDRGQNVILAGRDIEDIKNRLIEIGKTRLLEWNEWKRTLEKITDINVKEYEPAIFKREIDVGEYGHIKIKAFLGLSKNNENSEKISVRPYVSKKVHKKESLSAIYALFEKGLKRELKDIKKTIYQELNRLGNQFVSSPVTKKYINERINQLKENIFIYIKEELFPKWDDFPEKEEFYRELAHIKREIFRRILPELKPIFSAITAYFDYLSFEEKAFLQLKKEIKGQEVKNSIEDIKYELFNYNFPLGYSKEFIDELPRYLRALKIRIERAIYNPLKDIQKERDFRAFFLKYKQIKEHYDKKIIAPSLFEYMVMIFSPEFYKKGVTSRKKLEKLFSGLENFR